MSYGVIQTRGNERSSPKTPEPGFSSPASRADPKQKLHINETTVQARDTYTATRNTDGSISITINNDQNTIAVGYVRRNGEFRNPSKSDIIKTGDSRLLGITHSRTYSLKIEHSSEDNSTTIHAKTDPSLRAIKIELGSKVYYIDVDEVGTSGQARRSAEPAESTKPRSPEPSVDRPTTRTESTEPPVRPDSRKSTDSSAVSRDSSRPGQASAPKTDNDDTSQSIASIPIITGTGAILGMTPAVIPAVSATRTGRSATSTQRTEHGLSPIPKIPSSNADLIARANLLTDEIKQGNALESVEKIGKISQKASTELADLNKRIKTLSLQISTEKHLPSLGSGSKALQALRLLGSGTEIPVQDLPKFNELKLLVQARDKLALRLNKQLLSVIKDTHASEEVRLAAKVELLRSEKDIHTSFKRQIALESDSTKKQRLVTECKKFQKTLNDHKRWYNKLSDSVTGKIGELTAKGRKLIVLEALDTERKAAKFLQKAADELTNPDTPDSRKSKIYRTLEKFDRRLQSAQQHAGSKAFAGVEAAGDKLHKITATRKEVLLKIREMAEAKMASLDGPQKIKFMREFYIRHGDAVSKVLGQNKRADFQKEMISRLSKTAPKVAAAFTELAQAEEALAKDNSKINKARKKLAVQNKKIAFTEAKIEHARLFASDTVDTLELKHHEQCKAKLGKVKVLLKRLEEGAKDNSYTDAQRKSFTSESLRQYQEKIRLTAITNQEIRGLQSELATDQNLLAKSRENAGKLMTEAERTTDPLRKLEIESEARKEIKLADLYDKKAFEKEVLIQKKRVSIMEKQLSSLEDKMNHASESEKAGLKGKIKCARKELSIEKDTLKNLSERKTLLTQKCSVSRIEHQISLTKVGIQNTTDAATKTRLERQLGDLQRTLETEKVRFADQLAKSNKRFILRAYHGASKWLENNSSRQHPLSPKAAMRSAMLFSALDKVLLSDRMGEVPHSFVPRLIAYISDDTLGLNVSRPFSMDEESEFRYIADFISGAGDGYIGYLAFSNAMKVPGLAHSVGRVTGVNYGLRAGGAYITRLPKIGGALAATGTFGSGMFGTLVAPKTLLGVGSAFHGYTNFSDAEAYATDNDLQMSWRGSSPILVGAAFGIPAGPLGSVIGGFAGGLGELKGIADSLGKLADTYKDDDEKMAIYENLIRGLSGITYQHYSPRDLTANEKEVITSAIPNILFELLVTQCKIEDEALFKKTEAARLGLSQISEDPAKQELAKILELIQEQTEGINPKSGWFSSTPPTASPVFIDLHKKAEDDLKDLYLRSIKVSYNGHENNASGWSMTTEPYRRFLSDVSGWDFLGNRNAKAREISAVRKSDELIDICSKLVSAVDSLSSDADSKAIINLAIAILPDGFLQVTRESPSERIRSTYPSALRMALLKHASRPDGSIDTQKLKTICDKFAKEQILKDLIGDFIREDAGE
jgi:hypothetical protein